MKTIEIRSLFEKIKTITISMATIDRFRFWKTLYKKKTGKNPNELEIFMAGYMMSTPSVKLKYNYEIENAKRLGCFEEFVEDDFHNFIKNKTKEESNPLILKGL